MDTRGCWKGDWKQRIYSLIGDLGCRNLGEFLGMFPGETYHQVAQRLGPVAPMQLEMLHMDEARSTHCLRWAAMDALVRLLAEHVEDGWRVGPHFGERLISAVVDWKLHLEDAGLQAGLQGTLKAIASDLKTLRVPEGWLPQTPQDPILQRIFDLRWPVVFDESGRQSL